MDNTRKKLVENYEDALFALLMDDYMQKEGNQIVPNDDSIDIPDGMENRGLKSIRSGFRRLRLKRFLHSNGKIAVRIAIVVLAVSFVFSAAFFSVEAFRVRVLNMMLEFQDTHTSVQFAPSSGTDQVLTVEDVLKVLPEPYTLDEETYYQDGFEEHAQLYSSDGKKVSWQAPPASVGYSVDTEDADICQDIMVGQYQGMLVEKEGRTTVLWGDYDAGRAYCLIAEYPCEQVMEMVEKLVQLR